MEPSLPTTRVWRSATPVLTVEMVQSRHWSAISAVSAALTTGTARAETEEKAKAAAKRPENFIVLVVE